MIVSFLYLINYLFKVVQRRIFQSTPSNDNLSTPGPIELLDSIELEGIGIIDDVGIRFLPPAFIQRYHAVYSILVKLQLIYDIKKIVDIGCSEIAFFTHIKRLETVEEYIGVDIDETVLKKSICRVSPLHADYLRRRSTPLKVSIFKGSATLPDVRLKYVNAVVAIELIEHLFPPELDDLPYNIFGVVQPDVAIFTTPNADFNVLFRNLEPNTFRHYDHKFEWSRRQFEDWGHNLILRYPDYEVWFNGIGRGPSGTEEFGCCSQIAVFVRKTEKTESSDYNVYYNTVHEVEFPYETQEEKYNNTLEFEVYQFIDHYSKNDEYLIGDQFEIPLVDIINYITVSCTEERLKIFLEKSNKNVELKNNQLTLVVPCQPDEEESFPSYEGIVDDIGDEEESWIIENNDLLNDFVANDDDWGYVLENVNEMIPESNSNCDHIDDLEDFADEFGYLLNRSREDNVREEHNYAAINVADEPDHLNLLSSDEEELRAESVTPVGENQVDYLNVDSTLQYSSSTSANTSKSSDTLVENSNSPGEKSKKNMNDACSETNAVKDNISDTEQHPSSSSCNGAVETQDNIPDAFHQNKDQPFSLNVIEEGQKDIINEEINENEIKQNIDIPSSSSEVPVSKEVADTLVEGHKQVHCEQSSSLVPRSQSLENVNVYKSKDKSFRYSLNIDKKIIDCDTSVVDMDLETCKRSSILSLTETFGSHSKAVDSGYPNSTQEMDLDLTPEQVDEIITETESSLEDEDSSADERIEPVHGNPPIVFADNVENGDVANNNRDGEGNNMEGGQLLGEELIFEDLVVGGEEVEAADERESDDDGLFLSALDVSNDTIVPEELSSNDDTVYLFDLPSPSSFGSLQVEDGSAHNQNQFPSWLLNMEMWDDDGSGDAGPDRDNDSSDLVVDREGQVDFYPGDARAGGEPTVPED